MRVLTFIWEHILVSYWTFLPPILAAAIALIQVWINREGKSLRHLWTLASLYFAAAVCTCAVLALAARDAKKAKAEARQQMDRIEGKLGSEDATKRFLDAQRTLIDLLVKDKTKSAVDTFFNSLDERRQVRAELDQTNRRLFAEYEIRFRPVFDLVVKNFDVWVEGAGQRGIRTEITAIEVDPVLIGPRPAGRQRSRAVEFSGTGVAIEFFQASVDDGRLSAPLIIWIFVGTTRNELRAYASIMLNEGEYTVTNHEGAKLTFKDFTGKGKTPISDPKFIDSINAALNQIMAYTLERSSPP